MKNCILCNELTEGSVGAAGIKWPNICQPCKDKEDTILANRLEIQAVFTSELLKTFGVKNEHSAKP